MYCCPANYEQCCQCAASWGSARLSQEVCQCADQSEKSIWNVKIAYNYHFFDDVIMYQSNKINNKADVFIQRLNNKSINDENKKQRYLM